MAHVLMASIPAPGHVNPHAEVIRRLVERGHRVSYVNDATWHAQIEALGATPVAYPSVLVHHAFAADTDAVDHLALFGGRVRGDDARGAGTSRRRPAGSRPVRHRRGTSASRRDGARDPRDPAVADVRRVARVRARHGPPSSTASGPTRAARHTSTDRPPCCGNTGSTPIRSTGSAVPTAASWSSPNRCNPTPTMSTVTSTPSWARRSVAQIQRRGARPTTPR